MKKQLLRLAFFACSSFAIAQTPADKWHFGTNAGIDFSSGSPIMINSALTTSEGTASVSSAAGSLLFYTNGVSIWNAANGVMPNGTGLMGDISTSQSAMIVPSPGSTTQYYVFTAAPDGGTDGFRYSIVDMTLAGGMGDVVTASKNVFITDSTTEKIAAIKSDAGDTYWIVMHKWGTSEFYSYRLTSAGLQPPVISAAGAVHTTSTFQNTFGQMKFNMCGTKLALAIGYQDMVEVLDFNQTTGVVSNPLTISMGGHVYGVEFSKSGSLLYVTCYDPSVKLAQYNISLATTPLILASMTPLSVTDDLYGMQLAPDGKIYIARSFGTNFLGSISSPDTPGSGCAYSDFGLDLDPGFMGVNGALSVPSFMQTFLKVNVICSPPPVGIEEQETNSAVVYPNPAMNDFNIDLSQGKASDVMIYDYTGKLVEQHAGLNSLFKFGADYSKGIYFIRISKAGTVHTSKVQKM